MRQIAGELEEHQHFQDGAMSGGIVHPDGCRCPGCLPGQYVMTPAAPPRPRPSAPGPARPQPARSGSDGAFLLFWGFIIVAGLISAAVKGAAHHPAAAAWWAGGIIGGGLLLWGIFAVSSAPEKRAARKAVPPLQPPEVAQAPPVCTHGSAVPVDNDMLGRLAW